MGSSFDCTLTVSKVQSGRKGQGAAESMGMEGGKTWLDQSAESTPVAVAACTMQADIALRPATDADMDFLLDVFSSTRLNEFVNAGMPAEQAEPLIASQFSLQHDYYRRHYPHGRFDIIMRDEKEIGRFYHDWNGDAVQLIDIAILPPYRGAGIGTHLMRAMVAEAARRHMPMRLYVEFDNPVRTLYRALGFVPAGENGIYELMYRDVMPFRHDAAQAPVKGLSNHFQ